LKNGDLSLHRKKYRENIKNSDNLNGVHNCRTASIILALIFIFVLSDIPLLVFLYGQHDYSKLFSWAAGFVPFIGWVSIRLLEKINIFKLESGLLTKKGADIELNKLLGKKEIFKY